MSKLDISRLAPPDREYKEVGPGLWMVLPARIKVHDVPHSGRNLVYDLELGPSKQLKISQVGIETIDGTPITSSDWRAANPFEIWGEVGLWLIKQREDIEGGVRFKAPGELPTEELANLRSRGPSNRRTLEVTALAYNTAQALGIPASKYVQRVFSANGKLDPLPKATAAKWIRRCKDEGMVVGDA